MQKAVDPKNGTVVREVPLDSADLVEQKLAAATAAFPAWRDRSFADRAAVLRAVAKQLRGNIDEYAALMTAEMGKPVKEARGETGKAASCFDHYAAHGEAYLADEVIASDATKSWVQYRPLGCILGILPWNAPFWLFARFAAPAMMAGNVCLMKHDHHVPGCAQAIADVFVKAGAPESIFQALMIGHEPIEGLIHDNRVHAVSLTGSVRAGQAVGAIAGAAIKPVVLELGGSDPAIVLGDADLGPAADAVALMRTINAGQSCIAAKRVLVEDTVHDRFVGMLKERLARLKMGDPADPTTDIGPIARGDLRDELHRQVTLSVEAGATCVLGGKLPDGPGFFYPVTLLTDVPDDAPAFCEETFGPIAVVRRVTDADEAVRIANDSPFGLGASVFTTTERGVELANRIESGQVAVNGVVKTDPRLPSGGIKKSGLGRELGPHGMREFVNVQQVWVGPKQG